MGRVRMESLGEELACCWMWVLSAAPELQAHPALQPICCLCFVSSDHKHSGSFACFLSQFWSVLLGVSAECHQSGL